MFLKKENDQYFLSGGVSWIPLPEKLKTRKDVDEFLHLGKDPKKALSYGTPDYKAARFYEVYWRNGIYAQAKEDEDRTLIINVPPYATKNQITDALRQRAKTMDNKEVVIVFTEEAPEPPQPEP
jgi:hypothetical protein